MRSIPIPSPLAPDFGERIEALRKEADAAGHTDIGYVLEMAGQIADKRIAVMAMPPAVVRADELQPGA